MYDQVAAMPCPKCGNSIIVRELLQSHIYRANSTCGCVRLTDAPCTARLSSHAACVDGIGDRVERGRGVSSIIASITNNSAQLIPLTLQFLHIQ